MDRIERYAKLFGITYEEMLEIEQKRREKAKRDAEEAIRRVMETPLPDDIEVVDLTDKQGKE